MTYALSPPTFSKRGGLLSLVIGLHIGVIFVIVAAKTIVPQMMEMPLVVEFIQPVEAPKPAQAKPLPVAAKVQPVKQPSTPAPKTPAPTIETTSSALPAPTAPVAVQAETRPSPPAPPTEAPVSQARFDADYLKNPAPAYPPLSKRMGEEGKVILRVSVNPQGSADSVEIKTSSGSTRLDEAAQRTVRTWKFIPAKRGETAIQSWVLVPIIFKLEQ